MIRYSILLAGLLSFSAQAQPPSAPEILLFAQAYPGVMDSDPDDGPENPVTDCTVWTCDTKGDASGSIVENSSTELEITATGGSDDEGNINYAYQTFPDTGDIQVKARLLDDRTGHIESFTGFGIGITESTADGAYFAQCWWPTTGSAVRFKTGFPMDRTEQTSSSATLPQYIIVQYNQSAGTVACFESNDDSTYTQVGNDVSKTLSCTSDCPAYVFGSSHDASETTTSTITNASASSTLDDLSGAGGGGDPSVLVFDGGYDPAMHFAEDTHGSFKAWHRSSDVNEVMFNQIAFNGRPPQFGNQCNDGSYNCVIGNGEMLTLVTPGGGTVDGFEYEDGPARCGNFAAKFTIRNSANGTEEDLDGDPFGRGDDCDPSNGNCSRRRGEVQIQQTINDLYGGLLYREDSWVSVSHYLPADWDTGGSGWGPIVLQIKPYSGKGSPFIAIAADGAGWTINHRWGEGSDTTSDPTWQYQMEYTHSHNQCSGGPYPCASSNWSDGVADFPNVTASHAALTSLNTGGWTDWVIHVHPDERGEAAGGQGFLDVWKREDSGSWVKVIEVRPFDNMTRGGVTFDRGIGYNHPNGYGPKLGMYMDKSRVWGLSNNRVLYNDCLKVGSEDATFGDMSPDGSTP